MMRSFYHTIFLIVIIIIGFTYYPLNAKASTNKVNNNRNEYSLIDFMSEFPGITFSTNEANSWLGANSAYHKVGDINSDGIEDLILTSWKYYTYIIYGDSSLKQSQWTNYPLSNSDVSFIQGSNVIGVGDVNGDQKNDFLLAYLASGIPTAHLFFGGNLNDWTPGMSKNTVSDAIFTAETMDRMGHGMDGVGDVNGDGFDDFVIGSEFNDQGGSDAGKAYLILGRPSNEWNTSTVISNASSASFVANSSVQWFGMNVAGIGDVNVDGFDDFLIESNNKPKRTMYLFFGRSTDQWHNNVPIEDAVNITFQIQTEDSMDMYAGRALTGLGDVNNDQIDDFAFGAYNDDEGGFDTGQIFVFFGRPSNLWPTTSSPVNASDYANASFIGENNQDWAGYSVSGGGDINNDGYNDLLIGASNNIVSSLEGKAYIIFGRESSQWFMDQSLSEANLTIKGGLFSGSNARFATDVSIAGDINNDGFSDFLISAPWTESTREGSVFLIWGSSSLTSASANTGSRIPGFEIFAIYFTLFSIFITRKKHIKRFK